MKAQKKGARQKAREERETMVAREVLAGEFQSLPPVKFCKILNGPSKYDLILALFEGDRPVTFTVKHPQFLKEYVLFFYVFAVVRFTPEEFVVKGAVKMRDPKTRTFLSHEQFLADYSTTARKGKFINYATANDSVKRVLGF